MNYRVQCNQALCDDVTIQTGGNAEVKTVGLLGIINGLFGIDEKNWGAIVAVTEDSNPSLIVRFERRPGEFSHPQTSDGL